MVSKYNGEDLLLSYCTFGSASSLKVMSNRLSCILGALQPISRLLLLLLLILLLHRLYATTARNFYRPDAAVRDVSSLYTMLFLTYYRDCQSILQEQRSILCNFIIPYHMFSRLLSAVNQSTEELQPHDNKVWPSRLVTSDDT